MALFSSPTVINSPRDHATDLIIIVFFFAMWSCEFAKATKKGTNQNDMLRGNKILFKSQQRDCSQLSGPDQEVSLCLDSF